MKIIDLTHAIEESMPVYPGTEPPQLAAGSTYEKDGFKETRLSFFSHTGTHIDPPAHIFPGRTALDEFPVSQFAGKAAVIDCRTAGEGGSISAAFLKPYGELLKQADFLLFHTGWDRYWGQEAYFGAYPCIDDEVLDFILAGKYRGIGLDTIGLDPVADESLPRHKKLFRSTDIINIENLTNLGACGRGLFDFFCLPLKIADSDGAPARAIACLQD